MRSREDAKGRRRSVLMTPPVPEKVRVLSPVWYRAAVEFQGRPEQERLAFCSWWRTWEWRVWSRQCFWCTFMSIKTKANENN